MKERIEVTRERTFGDAERRPDRSEQVVAVRLHRRDLAPLVVVLDDRPALLVGRSNQAELRLHDNRVSRLHGLVRRNGTRWNWLDFGTGNGSFVEVDGHRIDVGAGESVVLDPSTPVYIANHFNWLEPLTTVPDSDVSAGTRSRSGREHEARLASVARSKLPILLHGPAGTGKTWAAQWVHAHSGRRGRFISINCARLPTDISQLHSELLGHVKGAFTGATADRVGHVYAADGGTLFLDEMDSAARSTEQFLLDVLEGDHPLLPLGMASTSSRVPPRPSFRVIAAAKKVGKLRGDLIGRMERGEVIPVPNLASRREDIPDLIERIRRAAEVDDDAARPVFSPEAVVAMQEARWPGEIRALSSAVTTLVDRAARHGARIIDVDAVYARLAELHPTNQADDDDVDDDDKTGAFRRRSTLVEQPAVLSSTSKPAPRHFSKADLLAALTTEGNNIDRTAGKLGWSRNTLTRKMDEFGIPRPSRS